MMYGGNYHKMKEKNVADFVYSLVIPKHSLKQQTEIP